MRRIRLALLLVSAATLAVVGVLAWRANQGFAAERAMRHQAVAERAFEEMERALGDFLAREEARPFEDYAFYLPVSGERSPLAHPSEPFVIGAFQVDPEGVVTTPLEPEDDATARQRGDWPPDDRARASAARVRSAVAGLWPSRPGALQETDAVARADAEALGRRAGGPDAEAVVEPSTPPGSQAPGTTRVVSGPGFDAREIDRDRSSLAKGEAQSAFDVLESLNRSTEERRERKQKVARAPYSALYGSSSQAAGSLASEAEGPLAPLPTVAPPELALSDRAVAPALRAAPGSPTPAPQRRPFTVTEDKARSVAEPKRASRELRVAIDPMVGVAHGEGELVLYRTVLVDRSGYRQGLVIDRAALGAWLDERVIDQTELGDVATLSFGGDRAGAAAGDCYVFAHRFAEPFDALQARLQLAPLPGAGSPGALYALVALLLALGAAGLYAVHRTVAVAVQYAERRSNFVAAVTHELKTPLTSIRMYAEMLRDGLVSGTDKRQEYYDTITDESERLSRLVDNVLEFSKLEGGRGELATTVGSVGPVLEEAAEKLAAHAKREGFSLEVRLAPELPVVRFDRDALLQVLFNLVDNAMKYARSSERRIVELEAIRHGDAVTVAVRDFGPGVSRSHLDRVFDPFYRGESELTRTTKGTGIGLALVKELAERMGAAVSGANADGGGFQVRLVFPIEGVA